MKGLCKRGLRLIGRSLRFIEETELRPKEIMRFHRLGRCGVHWSRYQLFRKRWLADAGIRTVLDIGANVGEFTCIFAELFPEAQVYAFEPLPGCFQELQRVADVYGRVTAFETGLGSKEGFLDFHRSSWAPASSFREMSDLHRENYPNSADTEIVKIPVATLDKLLRDEELEPEILVKLDVQGFEDEVIKGGLAVFEKAKILIIECSLQATYEGEPMFDGIYAMVNRLGFQYRGSIKQSTRKDDQSFLQADCIFLKE